MTLTHCSERNDHHATNTNIVAMNNAEFMIEKINNANIFFTHHIHSGILTLILQLVQRITKKNKNKAILIIIMGESQDESHLNPNIGERSDIHLIIKFHMPSETNIETYDPNMSFKVLFAQII